MLKIAIICLCTIKAMQCNAYAAMGLAPPTYDISGRKSVMKQNLFLRDIDKSHWLKSSSQISSELFSSPTVAIEQNEVADHIIINNRLMTTSLSVAMISIANLMTIELGARVTNNLHSVDCLCCHIVQWQTYHLSCSCMVRFKYLIIYHIYQVISIV